MHSLLLQLPKYGTEEPVQPAIYDPAGFRAWEGRCTGVVGSFQAKGEGSFFFSSRSISHLRPVRISITFPTKNSFGGMKGGKEGEMNWRNEGGKEVEKRNMDGRTMGSMVLVIKFLTLLYVPVYGTKYLEKKKNREITPR